MAVLFGSLPELWAALADAMSGRTSVVQSPPVMSSGWSYPPSVSVSGGTVTVSVSSSGGSVDLQCPAPAVTMAGVRSVTANASWRRSLVLSYIHGGPAFPSASFRNLVEQTRDAIVRTVFGSLMPETFSGEFPTVAEVSAWWPAGSSPLAQYLVQGRIWCWYFSSGPVVWGGSDGCLLMTPLDMVADICCGVWVESPGNAPFVGTPNNPDEQEALASLIQWPGSGNFINPADAQALRTLAEAINTAGSKPGQVVSQGGRPLLSVGGPSPLALPPWDGTGDTAMRSLALACQGFFSQGIVLPLRGNKRLVLGAGVIV